MSDSMSFDSFVRQLFPVRNPGGEMLDSTKEIPEKILTAYHCGPQMPDGFSLSHIGTGEGMSALGFGVYFATEEYVAKLYCKYAERRGQTPYLYRVRIDTAGLYNGIWGTPKHLQVALDEATAELARRAGLKELPWGRRLTHGTGSTGDLFSFLGANDAWKVLKDLGVTGAWESLGGKDDPENREIAVWDLSTLYITDVTRAVDYPGFGE